MDYRDFDIDEEPIDLVEEHTRVAETFANKLTPEEIKNWGNEVKDLDAEIEAAFEAATVATDVEPDYVWLDLVSNGRAFEVNPILN